MTVTRAGDGPAAAPRVRPRPFGRGPLAVTYAPDDGERGYLTTRVGLERDGTPPLADPPALGAFCGARVVDEPDPEMEAPGGLDIRAMHIDEDAANAYVTLVLGAPAAVAAGRQSWMGHFRTGLSGHFVRANLETHGTWTYFYGPNNIDFNGPTYFVQYPASGESAGNLIRIAVPRTFLASTLIRDTSARSYLFTPAQALSTDVAPDGSSQVFGRGGSYRLGACG